MKFNQIIGVATTLVIGMGSSQAVQVKISNFDLPVINCTMEFEMESEGVRMTMTKDDDYLPGPGDETEINLPDNKIHNIYLNCPVGQRYQCNKGPFLKPNPTVPLQFNLDSNGFHCFFANEDEFK